MNRKQYIELLERGDATTILVNAFHEASNNILKRLPNREVIDNLLQMSFISGRSLDELYMAVVADLDRKFEIVRLVKDGKVIKII